MTSRIEVIANPTACKARNADSRPDPGPLTSMSRVRMPCSIAFLAASSAATCAANGVDLREPLKPLLPDDDQAIALPCASVIVIIVLLKLALTCAVPDVMFLRSRRRRRGAAVLFAIQFFRRCSSAAALPRGGKDAARYFFLPAIGRAGPLRVRALVWVL